MDHPRIGELLSRIIPLSQHDVEEILNEQSNTNRRFGDIALAMGLCRPEHVWKAWLRQLESRTDRVSLDQVGVDTQALGRLPGALARSLRALPLRCLDGEMLLAVATIPLPEHLELIESTTGTRVRIVLTDANQLESAIDRYYPSPAAATETVEAA